MQSCGRWETRWAGSLCLYVIIDGFAVDFCVDFNTCFFAAYLVFIYFINIFYFFFFCFLGTWFAIGCSFHCSRECVMFLLSVYLFFVCVIIMSIVCLFTHVVLVGDFISAKWRSWDVHMRYSLVGKSYMAFLRIVCGAL